MPFKCRASLATLAARSALIAFAPRRCLLVNCEVHLNFAEPHGQLANCFDVHPMVASASGVNGECGTATCLSDLATSQAKVDKMRALRRLFHEEQGGHGAELQAVKMALKIFGECDAHGDKAHQPVMVPAAVSLGGLEC